MGLISSVLFGLDGKYHLGGIDINFQSDSEGVDVVDVFNRSLFGRLTNFLLTKSAIKLVSFGYLHVFIHEMGHALAGRLLCDSRPQINVYTRTCTGNAEYTETCTGNADYSEGAISKSILIRLAGPILSTIWEVTKLVAAIALTIFLPPPIGLPLGIFLGAGSVFWIFGEVAYACSRSGDWRFLRNRL